MEVSTSRAFCLCSPQQAPSSCRPPLKAGRGPGDRGCGWRPSRPSRCSASEALRPAAASKVAATRAQAKARARRFRKNKRESDIAPTTARTEKPSLQVWHPRERDGPRHRCAWRSPDTSLPIALSPSQCSPSGRRTSKVLLESTASGRVASRGDS